MSKKRSSKSKKAKAAQEPKDWFGRVTRAGTIIWSVFTGLITLMLILLFLGVIALPNGTGLGEGNVAVLRVDGLITTASTGGLGTAISSSEILVKRIKELDKDPTIHGLILDINSPGGSPVASDEVGRALKKFSKPTVAVIREVGASGAYWIATATDHIIANRMSVTGSIGVTSSSFGLEGLLQDYNITYRRQVAGRLKDAGTPFREPTQEENELFQDVLDSIYDEFIKEVAENRHLEEAYVRDLATGFVYLGSEALDLQLIDQLGTMDDAKEFMHSTLNKSVELAYYKEPSSLFDLFGGVMSDPFYFMGRGIGDSMQTSKNPPFMLQ
ncbi:signal peptide peptidase SppA [Candidatus Woesearchaeota archaeon]|nr:signal peptide peptidase SppA [Candidatus Woesearchaeota archaeon]